MYTNRNPIYVRTTAELTCLWKLALPCDFVIGEMSDQRWQTALQACRTKKMVILSWNECDVIFAPGDAWSEKRYTREERTTVAVKVELITQLFCYKQNHDHPLLLKILQELTEFLSVDYSSKVDWFY